MKGRSQPQGSLPVSACSSYRLRVNVREKTRLVLLPVYFIRVQSVSVSVTAHRKPFLYQETLPMVFHIYAPPNDRGETYRRHTNTVVRERRHHQRACRVVLTEGQTRNSESLRGAPNARSSPGRGSAHLAHALSAEPRPYRKEQTGATRMESGPPHLPSRFYCGAFTGGVGGKNI